MTVRSVRYGACSGLAGRARWIGVTLMAAGLSLLLAGCAGGKYVFDVFPEMHYEPSYRAQEPPVRDLAPGQVSIGYGEPTLSATETARLTNPLAQEPGVVEQGAALFKINCVPCHGQGGTGNGVVSPHYKAAGADTPADLTSADIRSSADGDLYYSISNGLRDPKTLVGMPAFHSLLTSDQRWALIAYIRTLRSSQ